MTVINIAIADDHAILIMGLKTLLESHPGLHVVIESQNGQQLLERLREISVDLIIMDVKMPGLDGIATTYLLKDLYPGIKVLAYSMYEEEKYIIGMMQAGANGYLNKTAAPDEMIRAVYSISEKGYYVNEAVSFAIVRQFRQIPDLNDKYPGLRDLNHREKEVLKLVCEEYSNQEIAQKLYVSTRTVEGYRSRLFEKSGAKNLAGLVLFAVRRGIVHG